MRVRRSVPYSEPVKFVLATIAILGVAASGPIMAATAAPAIAIAFWRNALGAVLMGAPTMLRQRSKFRQLTGKDVFWAAVAAVALAMHFACFITALKLTSVATATALVCLQSAWIVLFQLLRKVKQVPAIFNWPCFGFCRCSDHYRIRFRHLADGDYW